MLIRADRFNLHKSQNPENRRGILEALEKRSSSSERNVAPADSECEIFTSHDPEKLPTWPVAVEIIGKNAHSNPMGGETRRGAYTYWVEGDLEFQYRKDIFEAFPGRPDTPRISMEIPSGFD